MIRNPIHLSIERSTHAFVVAVAVLGFASASAAQETLPSTGERVKETGEQMTLGRDAIELKNHVDVEPVDRDFLDTAMIFSNAGQRDAHAYCTAHNRNGERTGRFFVRIPGKGLRFVLASDASEGRDFIGSVSCSTRGDLFGSALLLGAAVTDLPAEPLRHSGQFRLRFPVVATY